MIYPPVGDAFAQRNKYALEIDFEKQPPMFDQEDIITYNTWPLKIDHSQLEEIVMKNGSDLQQNLNQLLPPEPVFLSTIFLLQDAENIFEMQPAERLIVLKNVFGLLGIDEAKEQVNEERKQTDNKIKYLH